MKEDIEQKAREILKIIEDTIQKGPWESSNFLKAIGKSLRGIHDTLATKLNAPTQAKIDQEAKEASKRAPREGYKEIYVSLYAFEGSQLPVWEKIILNLPRQMISRPIYEHEDDVKALIRTKENKKNEAYVALIVKDSDILVFSPDKTPKDKLGKTLLTLKDKSIQLDNINRFVHQGIVYNYQRGRLIKNSS